MRITVFGIGSRGDVQPYVALAEGLARAGHEVRVATHGFFAPLLEGRGVELHPVGDRPERVFEDPRIHSMMGAGMNGIKFAREFRALLEPLTRSIMADSIAACDGSDLVVLSNAEIVPGFHQIAEEMGARYCASLLQPLYPTREQPSPFMPPLPRWWPGRGGCNLASHHLFLHVFGWFFRDAMPMLREAQGLPPASRREMRRRDREADAPLLFGFSPSVIARPADWPDRAHVTGYWFLNALDRWRPPDDLRDFLEAGPAPVYIGFGSMLNPDPEAATSLAVEALRLTGQRGILLTGAGAFASENLPEEVHALDSAPHDWLFPRMSAVVHHGGAGTTAAGLRSGVPSIVVPFFADQPFWARTVHALGVGPRPIPRKRLTAERLARTIEEALSSREIAERARRLAEVIRAEDGVGRAVEIITRTLMH